MLIEIQHGKGFYFQPSRLKLGPRPGSPSVLTCSPEPTQHIKEASARISTGSEEGGWCLSFPTSAGTSALPYLSLESSGRLQQRAPARINTLTGKDRRSLRTTSKQSCGKGGALPGVGGRVHIHACQPHLHSMRVTHRDHSLPVSFPHLAPTVLFYVLQHGVLAARLSPLLDCAFTEGRTRALICLYPGLCSSQRTHSSGIW